MPGKARHGKVALVSTTAACVLRGLFAGTGIPARATAQDVCSGAFEFTDELPLPTITQQRLRDISAIPSFLTIMDDSTILIGIAGVAPRVWIAGKTDRLAPPQHVRYGTAVGTASFLLFQSDSLYAVSRDGRITRVGSVGQDMMILDVLMLDSHLIVEVAGLNGVELIAYRDSHLNTASIDSRTSLAGPSRLATTASEVIIAAQARDPHSVILLNKELEVLATITLPGSLRALMTEDGLPILQNLVELDCSRVLLAITDLRSDRRWLVVVSLDMPAVHSWSEIRSPIGVVYADIAVRRLTVVNPAKPPPGITSYGWRWRH